MSQNEETTTKQPSQNQKETASAPATAPQEPQDILHGDETGGMDLDTIGTQTNESIKYITETLGDFGDAKESQVPQADELLANLEKTKKLIRDLQIDFANELIEWKDESGEMHEILLRSQDETRFEELNTLYNQVQTEFEHYVKEHFTYLRNNPDVLDKLGVE